MWRMASYSLNRLLGVNRCNSTSFLAFSSYFSSSAFSNPVLLGFLSLAFAPTYFAMSICFCLNLQTTSFPPAVALTGDTSGHVSGIRTFGILVESGKPVGNRQAYHLRKISGGAVLAGVLLWQPGRPHLLLCCCPETFQTFLLFLGVCSSTGHFIHCHVNYPSSSLTSIHFISWSAK